MPKRFKHCSIFMRPRCFVYRSAGGLQPGAPVEGEHTLAQPLLCPELAGRQMADLPDPAEGADALRRSGVGVGVHAQRQATAKVHGHALKAEAFAGALHDAGEFGFP